jgi:hypothetical protein
MMTRDAAIADAPAIARIYNEGHRRSSSDVRELISAS